MTLPRILTALILIPVVVALVWWAPTFLVAVLAALVMLLALFEFFVLGAHAGMIGYRVWTGLCALAIFYSQWLAAASHAGNGGDADVARFGDLAALLSFEHILILFVLGATAIVIFAKEPVNEALGSVSLSAAAILFLVFPLSSIIRIHGVRLEGRKLLLFTLVLVWAGDTLAYFVGKSIGQWRLAPHLSPKKTWEGAVANLAGSLLAGVVFTRWLHITPSQVLIMAALANIAGQGGDLIESAYKRSAGVKDSGTILPGHGGMLDRIDALVLAAPVIWYYFQWVTSHNL
ncbi:MAG TPA: phosphatidate cytidylyltransferase [Candidatus Acidoferrales bacterium]|nr:phosphatidate cytidylyltransferase [Candidatus Acidoferrales bacterium]